MSKTVTLLLLALLPLIACGEPSEDPDVTGESHWLSPCTAGDTCGVGVCLCGRCTTPCTDDTPCEAQGAGACVEPATCDARVCAPGCTDDGDCLDSETCLDGACAPVDPWACGGTQHTQSYARTTNVVTGPPERGEDTCVGVPAGSPPAYCSGQDAFADFATVDDRLVASLCFPASDGTTAFDATALAAGTVVTLRGTRSGDVAVTAERVALLGAGAASTTLDGDVAFEANTWRVRAVTITGSLTAAVAANNGGLSVSRVMGNLEDDGNGLTVLATEVYGDVTIRGEGAVLVGLGVGGSWTAADSTVCEGCYSFEDRDASGSVEGDEIGDPPGDL